MKVYENQCVGCPPEMGCLGSVCPYKNVPVNYCDQCDGADAVYKIEGKYYCEDCAALYLRDVYNELSISEKADMLGIGLNKIND